jgi:hypothetical protein
MTECGFSVKFKLTHYPKDIQRMTMPSKIHSWSGGVLQNFDFVFCLLAFLVFYVSFFPGILNIDATYQFGSALTHLRDWHSPIMTWIWAGLNRIYVGPALMLFLIQLELFSGLCLILRFSIPSLPVRCMGLVGLILLPMNFPVFGYGMKDSFFCANMLLGFALAGISSGEGYTPPRRFALTLSSFLFLFLAVATRPDGAAAVVPVFAWMLWNWIKPRSLGHSSPSSRFGLLFLCLFAGIFLSIISFLGIGILNKILCEGWRDYPTQVIIDHDLAGISIADHQLHFPPSRLSEGTTLAGLKAAYAPSNSWAIFFPKNAPIRPIQINRQQEYDELVSAWMHAIREHPFLYFQNRLATFTALLGLDGPLPDTHELAWGNYETTFGNFPSYAAIHAEFSPGLLIRGEQRLHDMVEPFYLFRPILYALLALGCVGYQIHFKRLDRLSNQASLVLALSGLAHLAIFFLCAPSAEVRFALWLTFSSLLGVLPACVDFGVNRWQKSAIRSN